MDDLGKEAEWTLNSLGRLEKRIHHPVGFSRLEQVDSKRQTRMIQDTFQDARRVSYIQKESPQGKDIEEFLAGEDPYSRDFFSFGEYIYFDDKKNRVVVAVHVLDDNNTAIGYLDNSNSKPMENIGANSEALVLATYKNGAIKNLTLRGEIIRADVEPFDWETISNGEWVKYAPILLSQMNNFLREQSEDEVLIYQEFMLSEFEDIKEKLGSGHRMLQEAEEVATIIVSDLTEEAPLDDRNLFSSMAEKLLVKERVELNLIKEAISRKFSSLGEFSDDEIGRSICFALEAFKVQLEPPGFLGAEHTLKIKDLSDEGFSWEEDDVEFSGEDRIEKAVSNGNSAFGEEIPVQDITFKVLRDGQEIRVMCSQRGRILWESVIPLRLDSKRIAYIAKNLDSDFRELKTFIPASFQRGK